MSLMLRLILVAAAMSVFLVAMVVNHHARRFSGTEIILDLEPVDPRDILAGYYVIISTPLHLLDPQALEGEDEFDAGDDIYVVVDGSPEDGWTAVSIHRERPENGLYINGKVERGWNESVRVRYNLERYYADEETAQALEQRQRDDRDSLRLIVSIDRGGRALIRGIEIEGERHLETLL
ncbi:GDYXXLXY domain-containing protein [Hyphobacterium sp.]|uniref:GDYXXLXY domain-containing protein n=1 Tax=Hyphobacterium sp. TaxID=2004662 RepID=UPI003BAB9704